MSCQRLFLSVALAIAASPVLAQSEAVPAATVRDEAAKQDADEGFGDREPSECLPLNRVRRTEIIDDTTIVFYVGRREAYVNNLPRRCPGLRSNGRFMYEVRQSRLCETDWITVLERVGLGAGRGFTCRLGVFHPASDEAVAILKRAAETGLGAPTSTATPVELPQDTPRDAASGEADSSEQD